MEVDLTKIDDGLSVSLSTTYSDTELRNAATSAQLDAWEAEASRRTADSYAVEPEDVNVKVYTSNGDGTYTETVTTDYSALHHQTKGLAQDASLKVNRAGDTMTGALSVPSGATTTQVPQVQEVVKKSGDTMTGNLEAPSMSIGGDYLSPFGFKNLLINGGFDVWKRGTSQTSTGYGSDDRWNNSHAISTKTHSLVACTDAERALFNSVNFSRTVVTSSSDVSAYVHKKQYVEDVTRLAGKTLTLSFWAKADTTKNIAMDIAQSFGTGGTPSGTITGIEPQLIPLTSTWTKHSLTVAIPSIIGKTLGTDGVHTSSTITTFWFDAGSNFDSRTASLGQQSGTFDIAEVHFEEGSVATPFEQRPIGLELSLCQRYLPFYYGGGLTYYSIGIGYSYSTTNAVIILPTSELPRIQPTTATWSGSWAIIDLTTGASTAITGMAIGSGTRGNYIELNVTSSGLTTFRPYAIRTNNDTTATLKIETEL